MNLDEHAKALTFLQSSFPHLMCTRESILPVDLHREQTSRTRRPAPTSHRRRQDELARRSPGWDQIRAGRPGGAAAVTPDASGRSSPSQHHTATDLEGSACWMRWEELAAPTMRRHSPAQLRTPAPLHRRPRTAVGEELAPPPALTGAPPRTPSLPPRRPRTAAGLDLCPLGQVEPRAAGREPPGLWIRHQQFTQASSSGKSQLLAHAGIGTVLHSWLDSAPKRGRCLGSAPS